MPKRIKHNDLTHYFLRNHRDLPPAYLASCRKFFNSFDSNFKPQAASDKHLTKLNKGLYRRYESKRSR